MVVDNDEIKKIMDEKQCDRETAWKLLKDREERNLTEERRSAQKKPEKKTKKEEHPTTGTESWVWLYYNQGFSIIPLGRNKGFWNNEYNDLKRPSLRSWDKYKTTLATKEEIQQWIDDDLFNNIGIICGKVSNNLVVIDIDDESIPETIGINLEVMAKKGAWVAKTGKGWHIYLRHHSNPGGIKKPIKYKIEYRANRGYVVAPPSIHPETKEEYTFLNASKPEDLKPLEEKDAKKIFSEMKTKIGKAWGISEKKHSIKGISSTTECDYPKCVEIALQTICKEGNRHDRIYGIASSFAFKKIPLDMALKKIKQFNMEKCQPVLNSAEVKQYVESAYKDGAKKYGCEFWMDQAELCPYEDIGECPFGKKKLRRELSSQYGVFKWSEKKNKETGEKYYIKTGVNCPNLGELFINEYSFNFMTTDDTQEILYYYEEDGCFYFGGENIILQLAEEFMEDLTTTHRKNEVVTYIRDYNYVNRVKKFNPNPRYINLNNGVYDIENREMLPHSPKYKFLTKIPVDYDPNATCPIFLDFLEKICSKQGMPRDEIEDTITEYMGYSLYRGYPYKKYIVLDGGGDNGKTTLLDVMLALVGEHNNTSVSLQELNEQHFAKAQLFGKHTNISDDLPKKALRYSGVIKQITGYSIIWADIKNHKKGIQFFSYAKPWYACNELPETSDLTDAFFSRMIQITLLNKFVERESDKIDNISVFQADESLIKQMTLPEELSGVLNAAIEGLHRLIEQRHFSNHQSTEEKRETWLRKTNPIHAFLEDEIEFVGDDWCITVDDFYSSILNYCERNGFGKPTKYKVTKKIWQENKGIKKMQKTVNRTPRIWCWVGIRSLTDETINHFAGETQDNKQRIDEYS